MLTIDKIAKHDVIVRLHPRWLVIERNINAADKLPAVPIETSHEISSGDNGPVVSGVSSDFNRGRIGDIQPLIHPWLNTIRFADFGIEQKKVSS